jgi:hypothetical protein
MHLSTLNGKTPEAVAVRRCIIARPGAGAAMSTEIITLDAGLTNC